MKNELDNNQFDDLELFFRKNLTDNEVTPSKNVWRNIEFELEKENRNRPKFFWWFSLSGIAIALLLGGYFLYPQLEGKEKADSNKIMTPAPAGKHTANKKPLNEEPKVVTGEPANPVNKKLDEAGRDKIAIATAENNGNSTAGKVGAVVLKTGTSNDKTVNLVQIGSFRNKPNASYFKKIPFEVVSKKGENGLTRYYVVSDKKVEAIISDLGNYGITETYVPEKKIDLASTDPVNKNEVTGHEAGISAYNQPSKMPVNTGSAKTKTVPKNEGQETAKKDHLQDVAVNAKSNTGKSTDEKHAEMPMLPKTNNNGAVEGPSNVLNNATVDPAAHATGTTSSNPTSTLSNSFSVAIDQPTNTLVTSIPRDSLNNSTPAGDSLVKNEIKKDTSNLSKTGPAVPTPLFTPQMAVILDGGPNITQSAGGTSNEKFPVTYTGNFKLQYTPVKWLSLSAGIGYSNYSVSKPQTDFVFDKYLSSDYIFNTAVGPVNVSKEDMLQGFFTQAPVPAFSAKYTYDGFIQAVNIPVEAQLNFLHTERFGLHLSAGVNTSYILTQRTRLSVIKENVTNTVSYSDVRVNKLNYLLLFGLGCDVKLKSNLYLTASPVYKYSLTSLSPGEVKFRPNYISGQVGLKYVFKH